MYLLQQYLQGTQEERTQKILFLLDLLVVEYNNMYPDKPIKVQ